MSERDAVYDSDPRRFFAEHQAGGPDNVVVATLLFDDGNDRTGIFHSIERAEKWANGFSDDPTYVGSVMAPYVIDVPDYGNVSKEHQQ